MYLTCNTILLMQLFVLQQNSQYNQNRTLLLYKEIETQHYNNQYILDFYIFREIYKWYLTNKIFPLFNVLDQNKKQPNYQTAMAHFTNTLSTSSLHHLILSFSIELKTMNYLIWRTQMTQLFQVMRLTEIITEPR